MKTANKLRFKIFKRTMIYIVKSRKQNDKVDFQQPSKQSDYEYY
jgi:hypothetical protein